MSDSDSDESYDSNFSEDNKKRPKLIFAEIIKSGIMPDDIDKYVEKIHKHYVTDNFTRLTSTTKLADNTEESSLKFIITLLVESCLKLNKKQLKLLRESEDLESDDSDGEDIYIDYEEEIISSFLSKEFDGVDEPVSLTEEIMGVEYLTSIMNFNLNEEKKILYKIMDQIVDIVNNIANLVEKLIDLVIERFNIHNLNFSSKELSNAMMMDFYDSIKSANRYLKHRPFEFKHITNRIPKKNYNKEDKSVLYLVINFLVEK